MELLANVLCLLVFGPPALYVILAVINFFLTDFVPQSHEKESSKGDGLPPLAPSDSYKIEDNLGF